MTISQVAHDHGLFICCRQNIGGILQKRAATSVGNVGGTAPLSDLGGASFIFCLHPARTSERVSELCPGAPGGLIYGLCLLLIRPRAYADVREHGVRPPGRAAAV